MDNSAVQYIFSLPYKIFFVLELCQNPFFTAFSIPSSYQPNPLLHSQLVWFTDNNSQENIGSVNFNKTFLGFPIRFYLYLKNILQNLASSETNVSLSHSADTLFPFTVYFLSTS